jgi:hypothetical protein
MALVFLGPNDTPLKMGVEEEVLELVQLDPQTGHWLWRGNLTPLVPETGRGCYGRINFAHVISRVWAVPAKRALYPGTSLHVMGIFRVRFAGSRNLAAGCDRSRPHQMPGATASLLQPTTHYAGNPEAQHSARLL